MWIAVDFDGTLTIDNKPWNQGSGFRYAGDPNKRIIDFVKNLHKKGHKIMIYSVRCNVLLSSDKKMNHPAMQDMLQFLKKYDIPL